MGYPMWVIALGALSLTSDPEDNAAEKQREAAERQPGACRSVGDRCSGYRCRRAPSPLGRKPASLRPEPRTETPATCASLAPIRPSR